MNPIYKSGDITEAHIIAGLLNANDIEAHVSGFYLQGGIGELAANDFVSVNVADEDVEAARLIVTEYEGKNRPQAKETSENNHAYVLPLIVIGICVLIILIAAVASNIVQ
ncbi:MAG: DUF2007 domain-containing protein [Gammaproteobacteria bacterium]|nr:DUF2007 domain-containing protein [Gammaproteobacteria bacterium]